MAVTLRPTCPLASTAEASPAVPPDQVLETTKREEVFLRVILKRLRIVRKLAQACANLRNLDHHRADSLAFVATTVICYRLAQAGGIVAQTISLCSIQLRACQSSEPQLPSILNSAIAGGQLHFASGPQGDAARRCLNALGSVQRVGLARSTQVVVRPLPKSPQR